MNAETFFQERWRDMTPRVQIWLARAGAPSSEREDLVQETALRLYTMRERVDWERPVEPLAYRIAINLWRDQWRRRGNREVIADIPEQACTADTERAALARVEVGEVARLLSTMQQSTARILRAAVRRDADTKSGAPLTASERAARLRARRALAARFNAVSGE